MAITAAQVKELREATNAGMMDCKKALQEADGDMDKAVDLLRKRGVDLAAKKASREASEGVIGSYVHMNNKIGVLVEVGCETDFVAKNEQFQELVKDLTLQIASARPQYLSRDDVPAEVVEKEKDVYREQVKDKPENVIDKILDGKLGKFYSQICLLEQPFVKDDDKSITDLINETIAQIGENIVVRRFARFEVGEAV